MTKPNATLQSMLIHLVEETSIPTQTNLWPSIRSSLQKSKQFSLQKDKKMKSKNNMKWRFVIPAAVMFTLILTSIFLFATPEGKVVAQDVVRAFTKGTLPDVLADRYSKTLSQASIHAGLTLRLPEDVPPSLSLVGAYYGSDQSWVSVFYWLNYPNGQTDGLEVNEQLIPESGECDLCGFVRGETSDSETTSYTKLVGMDAKIEEIPIGDVIGLYTEGGWYADDNVNGIQWHADPYSKRLRWQTDGIAYELFYWGRALGKKEMTDIARSIK